MFICFEFQFEVGKEIGFMDVTSQRKYDRIKKKLKEKYKDTDQKCSVKLVRSYLLIVYHYNRPAHRK